MTLDCDVYPETCISVYSSSLPTSTKLIYVPIKGITIYVTHRYLSRRRLAIMENKNIARGITEMKVGGKRPRGKHRLRWMDIV